MTDLAAALWSRAIETLAVARHVMPLSVDNAAASAYYAAFYAASALFAAAGRTFRKHTALESAVHRDLVKAGVWPTDLGDKFTKLIKARKVGHYGQVYHLTHDEAAAAVQYAAEILQAVHQSDPRRFPMPQP